VGQGAGLSSYTLGAQGGVEEVTLAMNQMPSHNHSANCVVNQTNQQFSPVGNLWTNEPSGQMYSYQDQNIKLTQQMAGTSISAAGGNQPHNNMQPYVAVSYCICLNGVSPD
jgi:microcystin-dependent protein